MSADAKCPHCSGSLKVVLSVQAGEVPGLAPVESKRTVPTEAEAALITEFRSAYLASVDAGRRFKIPFPAQEVRAARFLLNHWDRQHLSAIIAWVVGDKHEPDPGKTWCGWAHVVHGLASLRKNIETLDKKARAAMQGRAA